MTSRMMAMRATVPETDATMMPVLLRGLLKPPVASVVDVDVADEMVGLDVVLDDCGGVEEADVVLGASEVLSRFEDVCGASVGESVVDGSEREASVVVAGGLVVEGDGVSVSLEF